MDSAWRWTVFSVFIISSHNNVLVMCQNGVSNRPLQQTQVLRETGGPVSPNLQQMNSYNNCNLPRGFERGPEINPQCLEYQRPPVLQDLRAVPEFIRTLEPFNGRPCPLSVNTIQQSNLPQPCNSPLPPIPTNVVLPPINIPRIPNNILPYREPTNNPPIIPQNTPVRLEQGCSVPQLCSPELLPQQCPGIPFQLNRIPPNTFPTGSQTPINNLPFNSNIASNNLPPCEQIPTTLPLANLPKVPSQDLSISCNPNIPSITPCPCSGFSNSNLENYPGPNSPQCSAMKPFNLLPPPKLLSPVPNLLPLPIPFNSLRSLPFGPNPVSLPPTNVMQSCSAPNPPVFVENQGGNLISLPRQEECPLSTNSIPINQISNTVVQPSQPFPILNGAHLQGTCSPNYPPSNSIFNVVQEPNLQRVCPISTLYPPPFIPSPNSLPPCSLKTDLSSIQFLPQPCPQSNLFNNLLTNPGNIAAPMYQTNALPPVLPAPNVYESSCQNPITQENTAPVPINLQINVPPPIITPPKIIIVAPSPPAPSETVVEEDTGSSFEVFPSYPSPPIIIEGRRSRSKNWLPLVLVALCTRNCGCGCGGNYCGGNSGTSGGQNVVPLPIPIPTSNQIINN